MADRGFRLPSKILSIIASPWFVYTQVDANDAKECSVCWENCTSYLHCSNSQEHIVCKPCSRRMIENTQFVSPNASVDIKWKCPLCRHDNEIGSWQFLPAIEQVKAKEASAEQVLQAQQLAREREMAQHREQRIQRARERESQEQRQAQRLERLRAVEQAERQIIENRLSRIDENAPSKFRWVLSLKWKKSCVNHFKAWIMYTSSSYVENRHIHPPSRTKLVALKQEHHYEDRKTCPQAPWFKFLERTTPP